MADTPPANPLAARVQELAAAAPDPAPAPLPADAPTESGNPFAARVEALRRHGAEDPAAVRETSARTQDMRPGPTVERAEDMGAAREARLAVTRTESLLEQGVTPDVAAAIRRLARDEGVPIPLAAQTYVQRARESRGREYGRLLIENPGLRQVASQGTAYADFLDDAAALATTETAFNFARSGVVTAARTTTESVLSGLAEVNDIVGRAVVRSVLSVLPEDAAQSYAAFDAEVSRVLGVAEAQTGVPLTPSSILRQPSAVLKDMYDAIDVPEAERNVVTDVGGAIGQFGGQVLMYALTGGTGAIAQGFLLAVDEQAARVEAAGQAGTLRGDVGVLGAAGVNALIEKANLGIIFERIPEQLRNRVVRALATGTTEGVTEFLQATSANLVALGVYDPNTGVFDDAAYEGFLGGVVGAIAGALIPGRQRAIDQLPKEVSDLLTPGALESAATRAENTAQAMEVTRAAIEDTKTFVRDPEAVRELLEAAGDQEVTIPASEIERLYQEGALTDDDIAYLQIADEVTQQGALSGDVVTTASRVLTLQGDGFANLVEHVRTQPGAPTVAEAREAVATREADIQRLQGVLEQAQSAATEVEGLTEVITQQLETTGALTRPQRRAAARLLAERYAARAALFEPGTTAQSLYERDKVAFEAAVPGAALGGLTQRADLPQTREEVPEFLSAAAVEGVTLQIMPLEEGQFAHDPDEPHDGPEMFIANIEAAVQGEGRGTQTMEELVRRADATNTVLRLEPDPDQETDRLVEFYERFGFVEDPDGGPIMERQPRITGQTVFLQEAADIGNARRRLAEDPASLGLDADLAGSINPIYRPEALPPGRMKGSNQEAALFLEDTYADEPITDLTAEITPERLDRIATQMAAETELALESSGNAADWYSAALERTLSVAAVKYPMLTSDAAAEAAGLGTASNARFLFTYIMATTSQNLDVAANAKATDAAFEQMLERWSAGDYTMDTRRWGTGDKKKAMNENFAKFNRMLPKMPGNTAVERLASMDRLFRQSNTVGEWTRLMAAAGIPYTPPGQTAVDAVVYGSSTLGPKIGNGFWQNLNGNFDPLTIDLWMRRTWGRLTGKSIGLEDALPGQRNRLEAAVGRSRSRRNDVDAYVSDLQAQLDAATTTLDTLTAADFGTKKAFNAETRRLRAEAASLREVIADAKGVKAPEPYKAEYNTDNAALLAYAKRLLKVWDTEYKRLVSQYGADAVPDDLQPTWARAAKTIRANLGTPLDQVANGTQRRQIETAGRLAIQKLAARGINVTMADMQALLWYPEKELWSSLTRKLDVDEDGVPIPITSNLNESYDAVFTRILGEQGYEVQRGAGAGAGAGAAGDRTVFEQPAFVGERDQRADGEAVRADQRGRGAGGYSSGGLAPLEGAPNVVGASGPDPELVAVAERYAADNGIDLRRQAEFVEVDPERAARIAQAYEEMPHAPQDPAVQAAYADLIQQTLAQYQALVDAGYSFTFFDSETDPYAGNPWNAMRDLRANKTMAVYGTYDGYGTEGLTQGAVDDNPMLQDTGLVWKDQGGVDRPVTANDLFRAVHDAFGHGIEGAGFRARGEENAWQAHVRLFTGPAVAAITSETRGQNSWLNYGPYGEQNRTAAVEDTVFADQKTGLMPEWTWTEGRAGDALTQDQIDEQPTTLFEQDINPTPAQLSAASRGGRAQAGADEGAAAAARRDAQQQVSPDDLSLLETPEGAQEFFSRPGWGMVTASTSLPDSEFYRNQRENNPALYAMSEQRQADRNAQENARLQQQLDAQGVPYVIVEGMYKGQPDGTSFLVFADEFTVSMLGRAYGQESVLTNNGLIFTQRPQPNVTPTGEVQTGAEAQAQEFFSILPSGQAVTMGLAFDKSGPGVAQIPPGYTVDPTRPQLPIRPDGLVELFHWSGEPRETIDPTFAGSGPLRGEERTRGAKLSFYGINPRENVRTQGTGYVKESGLGSVQHVAFVDPQRLYPWFEDPEGLVEGKDVSAAEAAIKAAGYLGHYTTDDGSGRAPLGNVAAIYEPLPVQVVRGESRFEQPVEGPQTQTQGSVGAPRGMYRLPTKDDPRNLITLSAQADPSTFVHEVGHMFLFQMMADLKDPNLTEQGRETLTRQIEATRSWFQSNSEQAYTDLQKLAKSMRKRADKDKDNTTLALRASRLEAAVQRASQGGGAAYMERVAAAFLDPTVAGYDEAAEVVFHELWARGFEFYIGTGSAPSAELRSLFGRFAKYITSVYQSLRRLNVTVSPEIADVFDRLLATEEAIQQERSGAMYAISPGVLAGATPAEANELRKLAAEAEDEARTQMASRVANSLAKEARAARAARREELSNQVAEQVAAEPVYAAINIAKRGVTPDGKETGTGVISRAELVAVAGEDAAKRMPRGTVSGRTAPDNAIPVNDLATIAGFPDVEAMIEALTAPDLKSEADVVRERVDAAMQAEFGAETDPQQLADKAVEVAQNDKFQELQRLQLRILRRLATRPMQRLAQRQAEQAGAPAAAVDTAAAQAARAQQKAARTPREGIQAALARIRSDVQKTANASGRRAQAAARRQTAAIRLGLDTEAIRQAAERYVARLKVGDATPARYRQAASRLTAKIERAIAGRDYAEAARLMEQRALNLEVAKQAAVVQSKIEQQRTRWREVTARSDKRLAQRYSIDWVNAIRVLMEPFDLARSTPRNYDAAKALSNLKAVEPTLFNDIRLAISTYGALAGRARAANPKAPYKDLTVQEITDLLDTADTLLSNARDSHGLLVEGRRVAFDAIASEVAANVSNRRKVQKKARAAEVGRGTKRFREMRRQIGAFSASLRRIEQWARDFDNGDPRGPLTRYLVRPVMAAVDAYTVARRGPQEALAALLRERTDLLARKPIRAGELDGYVFQTKGELIMALLHTGNPSNKRKLLLGGASDVNTGKKYVWGSLDADGVLDTSRWDAFIDRAFADGILTKADMDLVQGVWDIFESTKPAAQAAHKQMYGYYFTEIEAESVVTPVGTYRGGYAPAITDTMMNPDGERFEAEEVMSQQSSAAMFPGAEKGFTQSRVEYNQPLDLDLTRVPAHFDRVMKFAYLGPAVRQAARLVTNKAFREAVRPGSPDVLDVAVIPWLQRTVQQRVTTPPTSQGWSGVSRVAAAIDRRVGLHIMAGNFINAAQQVTGFPVAAARIPARHLAAAATRWRVGNQSARAYIVAQSPFMQDRLTSGLNEAATTLENILSEQDLLSKAQRAAIRYGYFAQQLAQNLVDPTVWLAAERHGMEIVYPAAYKDTLDRTGDEAAADAAARAEVVAYADSVVRDTQAPLRASDVSGIEASTPLARLFLKFYSYFNAMGNLLVTEKNIAMNSEMGWAGRYGRSFYAYLMIVTIPTVIAESIAQLARGGFDDLDDEDERDQLMFELLIGSQIKTTAAMVPFVGTAVSTVYGVTVTDQVYDDRINLSAGIGVTESTLTSTVRLIYAAADPDTDVETRRAIKTTLDTLGLVLGLPTNWASKPISYAASVMEGDSRPEGMLDVIQGALTGRDGTER